MPLTIRLRSTGRIIGMTTFSDIDPDNRRLEIGGTWNARSAQRTGTNTESKLLLLAHAFDQLDCIAVGLRTHWLNHQSRRATERLGAKPNRTASYAAIRSCPTARYETPSCTRSSSTSGQQCGTSSAADWLTKRLRTTCRGPFR